ncbi:MAG: HAD-IA family hydrolase [Rhodospirillum sp.]|nr:HAD-IA family hydrolase [Rhodospirillum sp.]MCF8489233.1 HAD-IA family hydrolase [Rhodospirillum sp.]MCF8500530.1 HAD-IA family hydrolase [Rhodospirillum sp.]
MMDWAAKRMGLPAPPNRPERDAYHLARIRETFTHARANSPFYRSRRRWPEAGPKTWPETLTDLTGFPFTWPEDLVRNDPPLVAAPRDTIARMVTLETSGTMGAPKRIAFTADDIEDTIDYFHHGMSQFTRPGDRVGIAFPATRSGSIGQGLAEAARRLGAIPLTAPSDFSAEALVDWIGRDRPDVLFGLPVPFLAAARLSAQSGTPLHAPRAVLVSADNTPLALARALEEIWGCAVFHHWGMTETGYGGALECPVHDGAHVRETDLYLEIVDPFSGTPVPDGQEGEIVLTTLRRTALPLIRYRTGDLGVLSDEPCPCGSVFRRLHGPTDRIGSGLPLSNEQGLSRIQLDELLFSTEGITDYAATLEIGPDHAAILRLCVAAIPEARRPTLPEQIHNRLLEIPILASDLAQDQLHLEISLADTCLLPHRGKRGLTRRNQTAWPRAVLFDLDGTLVHSLPAVHAALNDTLKAFGEPPLTLDAVAPLLGGGAKALMDRVAFERGKALSLDARDRMVAHYVAAHRLLEPKVTTLHGNALETIQRLASTGRKIAIVTNKATKESKALVDRLGLSPWVDAVVGGDSCPSNKPDPDPIFLACRRLNLAPREALFVGDSREDIAAARAAGLAVILVNRIGTHGGGPNPAFKGPLADAVVGDLAEIFTHVSPLEFS